MLQAMYDAMIDSLVKLKASEEVIDNYKRQWSETLLGKFSHFPCPACFMAGLRDSALKAQPARASTFYVKCPVCSKVYSYVEEEF